MGASSKGTQLISHKVTPKTITNHIPKIGIWYVVFCSNCVHPHNKKRLGKPYGNQSAYLGSCAVATTI